ncbi:hypothetical protein C6499_06875 [Candidatus Poribacteria bacterium]|nr:MAG: hypothetical protein C6499_06875 [Candidatus Poribacteria bacterium]
MLNTQATLRSIFGILFILSITFTAFAQQEQPSGAALSQSQFMQILDKIDESEDEMRKHVDKKFDELNKKFDEKFDELDEKVAEIKTDVAVLNARVNLLQWVIAIIGTPFLISIIVLFVQIRLNQRNNVEIAAESKEESDEGIMQRILKDNRPSEPV